MAKTPDTTTNAADRVNAPRRRVRRLRALFVATLATGLTAAAIAAATDPVSVAGVPGITAPTGLARDANGALWVADSGGGVCRLVDPPFAPAAGLACPPKELQGPKSPGQMAFDPTTGMFFVGDGGATGGAVWRLHLDQTVDPAVIDSATVLQDLPSERVLGMAFDASTGALHYGTKDSPAIQRIENAATCVAPVAPCVSTTVGSALAKGARSLAHDGGGRLYLAEGAGVTRIENLGSGGAQAQPIPGFEGTYTALAFDPAANADGRIYAGTNNPSGPDWIDALRVTDDTIASQYSMGFAAVTAIGIDTRELTDRALDVTDDRGAKQFGEDTVGSGRRLSVPFEQFDRPTIIAAPPSVTNTPTVTFAFTAPIDTTFWCSLDGAPAQVCGTGLTGQVTYPDLADGNHRVQVQTDNLTTGGRVTRWFEVDTSAPVVTLGGVVVAGASAQINFATDEVSADFVCALDAAAAAPCDSPVTYTNLALGQHTVSVTATDFAGNAGSPVSARFTVVPAAVVMSPPLANPSVTSAPAVTPPVRAHSVPVIPWKPGPIAATLRGRVLKVAFDAPPGATYVRFTMTRASVGPVRTRVVRVIGGRRNVVQVVLSHSMAKRLQGKRLTLTVNTGSTKNKLTTPAGRAPLRVVAKLTPATGRTR